MTVRATHVALFYFFQDSAPRIAGLYHLRHRPELRCGIAVIKFKYNRV